MLASALSQSSQVKLRMQETASQEQVAPVSSGVSFETTSLKCKTRRSTQPQLRMCRSLAKARSGNRPPGSVKSASRTLSKAAFVSASPASGGAQRHRSGISRLERNTEGACRLGEAQRALCIESGMSRAGEKNSQQLW